MTDLLSRKKNIVLIGMPGAGKSTTGKLLAKELNLPFIDTDDLITSRKGARLQDMIQNFGLNGFLEIEEKTILSLDLRGHIISTGGSVIYSKKGIERLKEGGVLIYLDIDLPSIKKRFSNMDRRGVARDAGQTIEDLFQERSPLYRKHSHIEINCRGLSTKEIVDKIIKVLSEVN